MRWRRGASSRRLDLLPTPRGARARPMRATAGAPEHDPQGAVTGRRLVGNGSWSPAPCGLFPTMPVRLCVCLCVCLWPAVAGGHRGNSLQATSVSARALKPGERSANSRSPGPKHLEPQRSALRCRAVVGRLTVGLPAKTGGRRVSPVCTKPPRVPVSRRACYSDRRACASGWRMRAADAAAACWRRVGE